MITNKSFLSKCRGYICKKPDKMQTQKIKKPEQCGTDCTSNGNDWTNDGLLDTKSCYKPVYDPAGVAYAAQSDATKIKALCNDQIFVVINSPLENAGYLRTPVTILCQYQSPDGA